MKDIRYTVEFTLHNGDTKAFETLANECIKRAKSEPGTAGYEWYMSADGSVCHLQEWFKDSKAMLAHLNGSIVSDVLPKLFEVGEITGFDVHGDLTPEAEEALAAFGTRNFRSLAGFTR